VLHLLTARTAELLRQACELAARRLTIVRVQAQLVTKLRMLDKGTAAVHWRLRGSIGPVPVDVSLASEFDLDLITGRVRAWRPRARRRCTWPGSWEAPGQVRRIAGCGALCWVYSSAHLEKCAPSQAGPERWALQAAPLQAQAAARARLAGCPGVALLTTGVRR